MSWFTDALVEKCHEEYERFDEGKRKETMDPQYKYVGEYWRSIGNDKLDGKTAIKDKKGKLFRPAWSAAFISFVMRRAGAKTRFLYGQAHHRYIMKGMADREANIDALYWTYRSEERPPEVGDLICAGREYAEDWDYDVAKFKYASDSYFPSHCDVVVEVNPATRLVSAIGGNVSNSVSLSRYEIDKRGVLKSRVSTKDKTGLPWIGVMACRT